MLRNEGWLVRKAVRPVYNIGKVPFSQTSTRYRNRLWLNDGSIVRLKPAFPKRVWSYDFMRDRTHMVSLSVYST